MATWTDIPNASLEPGAPARSVDAIALRDNAVYLKSLVSGTEATKIPNAALSAIEDAALSTTVTTTGRDWVLNRNATAAVGSVGTYAFFYDIATGTTTTGSTLAASNLFYTDTALTTGAQPAGTWRCMGYAAAGQATLWMRIS